MKATARNGKVIAVANMKGGVGKSTTVVSLAEALCAFDTRLKVLVIDLDPQASASVAIAGDEELTRMIADNLTFEVFLEARLIEKRKVDVRSFINPAICKTTHGNDQLNVALLPCGPELRTIERELLYALARADYSSSASDGQIAKLIKSEVVSLTRDYDFVIFDCAPGISPVTEAAVCLSDIVLVPTIPDRLSVYGLNAFWSTMWIDRNKQLQAKSEPHVIIVRMNQGIRQHQEVFLELTQAASQEDAGFKLLTAQIPTCARLVEALMKPDILPFTQKYTSGVVSTILKPLVEEVRRL